MLICRHFRKIWQERIFFLNCCRKFSFDSTSKFVFFLKYILVIVTVIWRTTIKLLSQLLYFAFKLQLYFVSYFNLHPCPVILNYICEDFFPQQIKMSANDFAFMAVLMVEADIITSIVAKPSSETSGNITYVKTFKIEVIVFYW